MSNPNIAMLENVISAAVSTQYKEVPPTEEEFINLAQTMRSNMSAFAVTDDEFGSASCFDCYSDGCGRVYQRQEYSA